MRGAGPVLALGVGAAVLDQATAKALELDKEFQSGKKSWQEVNDELIRSVPIIGNIYSAAYNVAELFDNTTGRIKEAAEAQEAYVEAGTRPAKLDREENQRNLAVIRDIKAERAAIGTTGARRAAIEGESNKSKFADDEAQRVKDELKSSMKTRPFSRRNKSSMQSQRRPFAAENSLESPARSARQNLAPRSSPPRRMQAGGRRRIRPPGRA